MRTVLIVSMMCDRCNVVGLVLVAITCRSGALNNAVRYLRLLLLLLLYLSPLGRVLTIMYLKQTIFLGYTMLWLFCIYNLCYM